MKPEREHFLNLADKPARTTMEEAAWLLGFAPHEIPVLMAKGLLKPLGHPARGAALKNWLKHFLALSRAPK